MKNYNRKYLWTNASSQQTEIVLLIPTLGDICFSHSFSLWFRKNFHFQFTISHLADNPAIQIFTPLCAQTKGGKLQHEKALSPRSAQIEVAANINQRPRGLFLN